jgi:glutamate dehydrogenase (NAD(P)+)
VAKHGSVKGFEGAEEITDRAHFWSVDCDILMPAALEQQITEANANHIKAKIIRKAPTARPPRRPTTSCATRAC